jgi:hypothetical protein
MTRSTSIPIIEAASRSNEVARIAFPNLVRATTYARAIIRPSAQTTARSWGVEIRNWPSEWPLKPIRSNES